MFANIIVILLLIILPEPGRSSEQMHSVAWIHPHLSTAPHRGPEENGDLSEPRFGSTTKTFTSHLTSMFLPLRGLQNITAEWELASFLSLLFEGYVCSGG